MMNNAITKNQLVVVIKDAHKDLSQLLNALQLAQYIILVVQDRQDYISSIEFTKPSFIVLNVLLENEDGWNIAKKIKNNSNSSSIPLVLIDASAESKLKIERLGWRNVDCIAQGSEPGKIVNLITKRLSQKTSIENRNQKPDYEDLVQTNRQLQAKNRNLENFASMVSHDLQAPLRSLTMFSELLTSEYEADLDSQAKEYLERISNSGSRMQTLIENLLTYSRAGKSEQTWISIDLNQALKQVLENLHSAIAFHQVKITVGNLPQVTINPTEIDRLLQNILENAIKFSAKSNPQIEVTAVLQGSQWLISIADNGIGIAPEFQAEIFEPFKRLNSNKVYPGTGLGLAICQKIVQRYGGKIGVQSQVGQGSTFYFTLPKDACLQPLPRAKNLI